jgi:hypothetical protein
MRILHNLLFSAAFVAALCTQTVVSKGKHQPADSTSNTNPTSCPMTSQRDFLVCLEAIRTSKSIPNRKLEQLSLNQNVIPKVKPGSVKTSNARRRGK